jgi:hypothetical protein
MRYRVLGVGLASLVLAGCTADAPTDTAIQSDLPRFAAFAGTGFPEIIPLPTGFQPEGIALGRGTEFFVGSFPLGAIYRGDLLTGQGAVLVPPDPGNRSAVGLAYDARADHLFAAGGLLGTASVFDAATGATAAVYQLTTPCADVPCTLVNDVVVTRGAAYFTDSFRPAIYRVPLGPAGALPAADAVEEIPLTGDFVFVTFGDGIVLDGRELYVVQNFLNQIAVVELTPDLRRGTIARVLTHPAFRIPATAAAFGPTLYAVNARFDVAPPTEPAPTVEFEVVRVPKR